MDLANNNLETQADLDAAIAAMRGDSQEPSETPPEGTRSDESEQVDDSSSDGSDSSPSGDSDVPGGDGESEGDAGSEAEARPAEERLSEVAKEVGDVPAAQSDPVQQLEAQVVLEQRQLASLDVMQGLPQGNIYAPDGQSIYAMEPAEINQYLMQLRDSGKELEAGQVQAAYLQAVQNVQAYQQRQVQLMQAQEVLKQQKDHREWQGVRQEWLGKLPEIEPHITNIAAHIDRKSQFDPVFALQLESQSGKMRAVLQAVRELGIDAQLTKNQPKATINTPSAPDTQAVSKKVTTQGQPAPFTREQIAKMSQSEYLANEAEIDRQLKAKLIR